MCTMENKNQKPIEKKDTPIRVATKNNLLKELLGFCILAGGTYVLLSQTK